MKARRVDFAIMGIMKRKSKIFVKISTTKDKMKYLQKHSKLQHSICYLIVHGTKGTEGTKALWFIRGSLL